MDFLKAIASKLAGPGAYDEPVDTFKLYAPPSLWDAYTPEQQAAYGRQIQSQQRSINADYRPKFQDVQKGIAEDYANRAGMEATAAMRAELLKAMPGEQAAPGVAGGPAAQVPSQNVINANTYRRAGDVYARMGQPDKANKYFEAADKLDPRETYSAPTAAIDANGSPVLVQPGSLGGMRPVQGYGPVPPKAEPLPSPIREAMVYLGIPLDTDPRTLTPAQRQQIQNIAERQRALGGTKVSVNPNDPTAIAKAQVDLMKDYEAQVSQAGDREVPQRYRALQAAMGEAAAGNPSADGAIIYNIAKISDPSGAVQEGDKKTIVGARNLPETVRGVFERWSKGGSLTENERKQLYAVASSVVKSRSELSAQRAATFTGYSRDLFGDGKNIVNPYAGIDFNAGTVAPKPISVPGGAPPQQPSKPLGAHFGGR
jgi:tetratricopeptide (TPR) repeat protein